MAEHLSSLHQFWEHWGFSPWQSLPFAGVARRQRFVKDGILGSVAEYGAWEAIVWRSGSQADRNALWKALSPLPEVITQRFLFLLPDPWPERRIRSFLLGFRGYAEFYAYHPDKPGHPKVRDLTGLIDLALTLQPGWK